MNTLPLPTLSPSTDASADVCEMPGTIREEVERRVVRLQTKSAAAQNYARALQLAAPQPRTTVFGQMLCAFREKYRLSFRDLERLTGVDHLTLFRLENGKSCEMWNWVKLQVWMMNYVPLTVEPSQDRDQSRATARLTPPPLASEATGIGLDGAASDLSHP